AAQVLAPLEVDRAAVNLGDVADDGEAETGAGLSGRIEPRAAREERFAIRFGNSRPVVLDLDVNLSVFGFDRHEHAPSAVFGGVFDQVADHLVEVLTFDAHLRAV